MKPLIIFGLEDAALLALHYFNTDTDMKVSAFCVDREFMPVEPTFANLPVVAFEDVIASHPPKDYDLFVAIGYSRVNAVRKEKYLAARDLGYALPSYVSSRATVLNDGSIGDNCFILENNTIQPFAAIGNNVTLWSGNHIGHHSVISDHCFLASHIVVSGHVAIGESCFVGVNATIRDQVSIGANSVLGAGTLILSDVEPEGVYIAEGSKRSPVPSSRLRRI